MFFFCPKVTLSKGNFYHRLQLQDDIEKIFNKIMKLHTYQEDWFRLKAIYNDFYGDPAKDALKKYIKRLEIHIHNRLERKGLTDFRIKKGLTGVRQSPIVNKFYTDHYTPEYSLKKAFDFLDRKEFNYYMWWFQFIDKEDANLRVHLEDAIDELHDQNIFNFYEALEPRTPPDKICDHFMNLGVRELKIGVVLVKMLRFNLHQIL